MIASRFSEPSAAAAPSAPTTAGDRATSFRSVEGGTTLQSGEKLLVEAYSAIWLIVFALVMLSFRKQAKLDARLRTLENAVEKARNSEAH